MLKPCWESLAGPKDFGQAYLIVVCHWQRRLGLVQRGEIKCPVMIGRYITHDDTAFLFVTTEEDHAISLCNRTTKAQQKGCSLLVERSEAVVLDFEQEDPLIW